MSWFARLRNVFRADKVSDEIDREMAFHLAERADDLVDAGVPPDEARREARRRFGSYVLQKENTRDRDILVWLETLFVDFRYGLRGLRRNPVFGLTTVLTLAIGIGANTAVFTLLYGLLLRSLPVAAPQELARIGLVNITDPYAGSASLIPYRMLQQLRQQQRSFVDISAWSTPGNVHVEDQDGTLRKHVTGLVSGNSFALLGLRPRLGRLITPSDDVPGGPAVGWPVVLSDSFWRDRFGGDPGIIGAPLKVSGTVVTIVGVTPASFHGVWPGVEPKLYLPMQFLTVLFADLDDLNSPRSSVWCAAIGRLKPGVSFAEANAEVVTSQPRLLRDFSPPDFTRDHPLFREAKLTVESARTGLPTFFGRAYSAPLSLMQGLVALVLLLCCVNVSGLMMSKLHERQHELAVRTAMGAARVRLIRQCLTESFVMALAGAALGAAAAWYGSGLLLQFFRDPMMGTWMSVQPDHAVFLVTAALAVCTTLFFGILPAWRASRGNPAALLKSRTAAERQMAGRGFVAVQVALSLVLVALATLLSQSLIRLRGEDTGFDVHHVTIQTPSFHLLPLKGAAKLDLYQRMVDRIARSPRIRSAAVTWYTPLTGFQSTGRFEALGDEPASPDEATLAYNMVGPGYFRTMATAILAGREFEAHERRRDVCVLNEAAANFLFRGQAALGRYVRSGGRVGLERNRDARSFAAPITCRVVGIAEDAKFASPHEPPPRTIYFPLAADLDDGNLVFLMNAPTKADAVAAYTDALQEIVPTIPLSLFVTLQEQMDASLGSQRAITLVSTCFAAVALLLSAIGLYGMLSSSVTQRTGEIGVRAALGASRGTIVRMILSDALRLVGIGALLGMVALFFAVHAIEHMLYGVSEFDLTTLVATGALLTVVVITASFWPARRAASIDPMRAMRAD
ncbi:MAG: FtsX-like permease family protein [Luteitalea sp.]|nr:FtsX-like permease family protein [Luteitalea sp.]